LETLKLKNLELLKKEVEKLTAKNDAAEPLFLL
jgi:hypothetical protein